MKKHETRVVPKPILVNGINTNVEYKVFSYLVTDYQELVRSKRAEGIRKALRLEELSSSGGVYFYRFLMPNTPFLKIGSTQRTKGIDDRLYRGWSESKSYTDTYVWSMRNKQFTRSKFREAAQEISVENPAYFVFYALPRDWAIPASDEYFAMRQHREIFPRGTVNIEPAKDSWGRELVFAPNAFEEVRKLKFPDGSPYPAPAIMTTRVMR